MARDDSADFDNDPFGDDDEAFENFGGEVFDAEDQTDDYDEDFSGEDTEKEPPSKLMLAGIAGGTLLGLVVVMGLIMALVGGGGDSESQYTQEDVDNAYQMGADDASKEYQDAISGKNKEIDDLTGQVRDAREEVGAAQRRADGSSDQSLETLREAQRAIDDISRDRDKYKRLYEDQVAETDRAHDRIRTLEHELGR